MKNREILKKLLLELKKPAPVRAPHQPPVIAEKSDEQIFREAMSDVNEIKEFSSIPYVSPRPVRPYFPPQATDYDILKHIVLGTEKIRLTDTGEYHEGVNENIRKDLLQRLHNGEFSVQDSLDLHGMTVSEAERAVRLFIHESLSAGKRCVKIIHGRGLRSPNGPVLKRAIKQWLKGTLRKWVLAYATARDCDGGLGATYVVLKWCEGKGKR